MIFSFLTDLRLAARALAKTPAFTAVAVMTLAVAIGATTAIFSVVDGVLLRPLPYPDAGRLVSVAAGTLPLAGGDGEAPFSDRGYWHFVNNNRSFDAFGAYAGANIQWPLTADGPPQQVDVAAMTLSAFEVIGAFPERGRFPSAEEDIPDGAAVVLISHGLWVNRYGSDPAILGRTIELNGASREVIGVMPPAYDFPTPETDVWVPRQLDPASENFGGHHLNGIARLSTGVTVEAATADAESLIARFDEIGYGPEWFVGIFSGKAVVRTLRDQIIGGSRRPLLILLGTGAFVLLIACSNIANLFLVRAEARSRELAVRMALGSGRGRLIQYVMTESVLLSLIGGGGGILLAMGGTRALVWVGPASIPRMDEIGINGDVLWFTVAVSLVAGLLFGVLPAIRAGSRKVLPELSNSGRGSTIGRRRHRARSMLVVAQVALALVLLIGSGLMVRSFQQLRSVDPGFVADGIMTFRLSPPPTKYEGGEPVAQFYDELIERLEAIPGAVSAAGINNLPLTGGGAILTARIDEFPVEEGDFPPSFLARRVTPGYFKTMGVPIVEGREFIPDDHNARLGSLVISESVKREFWPDESALGKRITHAGAPGRVVGVVGDVRDTGLEVSAEQFVYKPMLDSVGGGVRSMMLVVRTDGEPNALIPSIRAAVDGIDPMLPITNLESMEDLLADSLSRTSFTMSLLVLASIVAVFLGSVGIYGVLAYVVSQRTSEIGVRLALGADTKGIRNLVVRQGMGLAVLGIVVGILAAGFMTRLLSALLFEVSPLDVLAFGGGSGIFLAAALLACLFPAMRATSIAPVEALRGD